MPPVASRLCGALINGRVYYDVYALDGVFGRLVMQPRTTAASRRFALWKNGRSGAALTVAAAAEAIRMPVRPVLIV